MSKKPRLVPMTGIPHSIGLITGIINVAEYLASQDERQNCDLIILNDTSDPSMLGEFKEELLFAKEADKPVIVIDHHMTAKPIGTLNVIDPFSAATCELLYLLFREANITKDMAHALGLGVFTDTGLMRTSHTTSRTLRVFADLIDLGANRMQLLEQFPVIAQVEDLKTWGDILQSVRIIRKPITIVIGLSPIANKSQATSGIVSFMRDVGDVDMAVLIFSQGKSLYKISLRSKPWLDVSEIAAKFNGGGHRNAAGFTIMLNDEEDVINQVSKMIITLLPVKDRKK